MKRTTPLGLFTYAKHFYESYSILENEKPNLIDLFECKFFLLGRVFELLFKSLLLNVNFDLRYLKKIGHDLQILSALTNIRYLELNLNYKDLAIINLLNNHYLIKEFEYPVIGSKQVPNPRDIQILLNKIFEIAKQNIHPEIK